MTSAGNKMSPITMAAAQPSPVRHYLTTICVGSLPARCPVRPEEARHRAIPSLLWIAWKGGVHGLLLSPPSHSGAMLGRSSASVRSFIRSFTPPPPYHAPSGLFICTLDAWWLQLHSPITITRLSSVPTAVRGDITVHRGWLGTAKGRYAPDTHPRETVYRQEQAAPIHFFPEQRDELPVW